VFWQQVERGHREDLPEELLADLRDIRLGQVLGVPAPLVRTSVGIHWIASALIKLEAEAINQEYEQKRSRRRRR
jgi:hypothetical protein